MGCTASGQAHQVGRASVSPNSAFEKGSRDVAGNGYAEKSAEKAAEKCTPKCAVDLVGNDVISAGNDGGAAEKVTDSTKPDSSGDSLRCVPPSWAESEVVPPKFEGDVSIGEQSCVEQESCERVVSGKMGEKCATMGKNCVKLGDKCEKTVDKSEKKGEEVSEESRENKVCDKSRKVCEKVCQKCEKVCDKVCEKVGCEKVACEKCVMDKVCEKTKRDCPSQDVESPPGTWFVGLKRGLRGFLHPPRVACEPARDTTRVSRPLRPRAQTDDYGSLQNSAFRVGGSYRGRNSSVLMYRLHATSVHNDYYRSTRRQFEGRQPCSDMSHPVGMMRVPTSIDTSLTPIGNRPGAYLLDKFSSPGLGNCRIRKGLCVTEVYSVDPRHILGTGISGTVRMGVHKQTGDKIAIKSLNIKNLDPKKAAMLYNEVAIYLSLDHPNICKLLEVYEDNFAVHLAMQLCSGNELYDRLASLKRFHETDAKNICKQMLLAIHYCHTRHICHRDLKLENWVFADTSKTAALKLIDFGFSRIFNPGMNMTAMHGTVYYVAPEVMDGAYNEKCDCWSYGVIVYMLLSGCAPFNGTNDHEILIKIKRGQYPLYESTKFQHISEQGKDFIANLLVKDVNRRFSAAQALQHPWLTDEHFPPLCPPALKSSRFLSPHKKPIVEDTQNPNQINTIVLDSIISFSAFNSLKRAALGVVAYSMHVTNMDELNEEFRKFDLNNSGSIDVEQLVNIISQTHELSPEVSFHLKKTLDLTGNQKIDYTEFIAACISTKLVLDEALIRELFVRFDLDHTGYISLDNLRGLLGNQCSGRKVEDILSQCDPNNKGQIDYQQFYNAICSEESQRGLHNIHQGPNVWQNLIEASEAPT